MRQSEHPGAVHATKERPQVLIRHNCRRADGHLRMQIDETALKSPLIVELVTHDFVQRMASWKDPQKGEAYRMTSVKSDQHDSDGQSETRKCLILG